jgi:hypothetical protein
MKPPIKKLPIKILLGTFIIIFSSILACAVVIWLFLNSGFLYKNQPYQEILSPDNQYKVVIGLSYGGTLVDDSTFVSILSSSEKINNIHGTRFDPTCIMGMDEGPHFNEIRVEWTGNRSLKIYYANECLLYSGDLTLSFSNVCY